MSGTHCRRSDGVGVEPRSVLVSGSKAVNGITCLKVVPGTNALGDKVFIVETGSEGVSRIFLSGVFVSFCFRRFLGELMTNSAVGRLCRGSFMGFYFPLPGDRRRATVTTTLSSISSLVSTLAGGVRGGGTVGRKLVRRLLADGGELPKFYKS